ncbi:hypothetical protein KL86DYS2_10439 [uncultured Dysgonomonas sp.]|uniref:Uncharacterized protein n=1 Tax=uncultured Dysgonomonas sp. TaxID=206096 RepID=A0A212J0A3_9BACT|nr:hypothetical protein [uncultured Dysgonomonas sp.]SBV92860.1 hypothetical protein KL86DYS2_10439 [uncultured Dysgonomonas sp.]
MPSFTVCPKVIEYSKLHKNYLRDILMAFIPDNSKKICLDSNNLLLEEYKKIIVNDRDLWDWLRFLDLYEDTSIEKIDIDSTDLILPLELSNKSFDKHLIVNNKSEYSAYKEFIELNKINILEKDIARYILNYSVDIDFSNISILSKLNPNDVYSIILGICSEFKSLIEKNGLFKLLVEKTGKRVKEKKAQLLFYGIAHSICIANDLKLSPEIDSGNGSVDFNLSQGLKANVNIEVKFADNPQLEHGIFTQLQIYNEAEHTNKSIYLIIKTDNKYDSLIEEIQSKLDTYKTEGKIQSDIIIIDSSYKESASVRKS